MTDHPIENKNSLEEAVLDREIRYTRHFKENSEVYIVTAHVINKTKREKSKMIG